MTYDIDQLDELPSRGKHFNNWWDTEAKRGSGKGWKALTKADTQFAITKPLKSSARLNHCAYSDDIGVGYTYFKYYNEFTAHEFKHGESPRMVPVYSEEKDERGWSKRIGMVPHPKSERKAERKAKAIAESKARAAKRAEEKAKSEQQYTMALKCFAMKAKPEPAPKPLRSIAEMLAICYAERK